MQNIAISVQQVAKDYGDFRALKTVSLDIREGEFFTLLGPSGCGKTTLLKLLGGFEQTTAGSIHLFGEEIEKLPANRRPINTVFQQYALFPHMTIHENVQFGMKMLGVGKAEREQRGTEMLAMVQLEKFAHRRPAELSGGQQQRVALARALAPRPRVLLLDEPLSALDLKLRQAMRSELKQIQQQTGITFVFVTHDQEEALTMSDRIAVMSAGVLQQVGAPRDIYEEPANRFVADFIGETNLLDVDVKNIADGTAQVVLHADNSHADAITLHCPAGSADSTSAFENCKAWLSIRPERLAVSAEISADSLQGVVQQMIYMGTDTQYVVQLPTGQEVVARMQNFASDAAEIRQGQSVALQFDSQAARLLAD